VCAAERRAQRNGRAVVLAVYLRMLGPWLDIAERWDARRSGTGRRGDWGVH
jgi:hypothetical protein